MEHLPWRKKVTIFLATMSAMFFSSINQTIVGTSLPHITEELGGKSYFNWVFTIYMLSSSLTAVLVGKLSDMYGRKLFLMIGIGVFLIGSFLNGTADSMLQLIAYRGIQGAGGGMVISTDFASIGDLFVPRERARWQGYMSLSFGTASLFGFIWLSFTMSMMAASTLSGQRMTKRGTYKRTAMIGFILLSAAMLLLTLLGTGAPHVLLAMTLVLLGAGIGINFPVFTVTAQNAVGYSRIGAATSSSQLFRQTGGTVGVSLMGFVLGTGISSAGGTVQGAMETGLHAVFLSISLLALCAVFIVIYLFQEIPLVSENKG